MSTNHVYEAALTEQGSLLGKIEGSKGNTVFSLGDAANALHAAAEWAEARADQLVEDSTLPDDVSAFPGEAALVCRKLYAYANILRNSEDDIRSISTRIQEI